MDVRGLSVLTGLLLGAMAVGAHAGGTGLSLVTGERSWAITYDKGEERSESLLRSFSGAEGLKIDRETAASALLDNIPWRMARIARDAQEDGLTGSREHFFATPGQTALDPARTVPATGLDSGIWLRGDRFSSFAAIGWRPSPERSGITREDPWYASLGGSYRFTPDLSGGLAYDLRARLVAGGPATQGLSASLTQRFGQGLKVQGYVTRSLSEPIADWGAGAVLSVGF